MKLKFRNIVSMLSLFSLILNFNCDRSDPYSSDNNANVQQLQPLAIFNLSISEPSGIAYNSKNNTLMIVSDANSDIYETNLTGNVLRTISTTSSDMEGITLSQNCDTIFVVEEKNKLVTAYLLSGARLNSFLVDVSVNSNHALEGITRNNSNGHLIVLNEKQPSMLLEFDGTTEIWRKELNYSTDISDVFYEQQSDLFWIVSDESQKIMKLAYNTNLISEWKIPIKQAEGITIVKDNIYIVSDVENKMYIFNKP